MVCGAKGVSKINNLGIIGGDFLRFILMQFGITGTFSRDFHAGYSPEPTHPITPVILCGGNGTRLLPVLRKSFPKPILIDGKSLLHSHWSGYGALATTQQPPRFAWLRKTIAFWWPRRCRRPAPTSLWRGAPPA